MSTGQRPRWREYFPRMKHRGSRGFAIIRYGPGRTPAWPPVEARPDAGCHYRRYPHWRSGRHPDQRFPIRPQEN